jgi:hypothetical protein
MGVSSSRELGYIHLHQEHTPTVVGQQESGNPENYKMLHIPILRTLEKGFHEAGVVHQGVLQCEIE